MTTNHTNSTTGTTRREMPEGTVLTGLVLDPDDIAATEISFAGAAYESIRALNHLTIDKHGIPAPEVYTLLGSLSGLGYALKQAVTQVSSSLAASLRVYAVYEDDGGNPEESVMHAMDAMHKAAAHAARLGALLEGAQIEISRQGYHRNPNTRPGPSAPSGRVAQ